MPELAEVEYFRKQWDPGVGDVVTAVQLHGEKRIFRGSDVVALKRRLVKQKLLRSAARGKQMLFVFGDGNWLGLHLGMTGELRIEPAKFRAGKHDHLVLQQSERALVFRDARQFGRVRYAHEKEPPAWWQALAPDIGSTAWTKPAMARFLQRHGRAPIKAVLLSQVGFPGVGNWMADEILWRAHLSPQIRAGKLTDSAISALYRSTRFVARAALQIIGTDWSDPPRTWLLHERWKVDGKCPRHGTTLKRATIGGRTTAWCAKCQPARVRYAR